MKQEIDQTAARASAHTARAEARMVKPTTDRADRQAVIAKRANGKAPARDQLLVDKAGPAPEPPGWSFSALAIVGYAASFWRNVWPPKDPKENAASGVQAAKAAAVERKVEHEGAGVAGRIDAYVQLAATWFWNLRGTKPPFLAALKEIPRNQAADTLFWAFGAVASLWFMLCIIFRIGGDTRPEYFMIGLGGAAVLWGSGWLVRAFLLGRNKFRSSDLSSYPPAATERHSDEVERSPSKRRVKQTTKRATTVSNAKRRRRRASAQGQEPATGKPANRTRKIPAKR